MADFGPQLTPSAKLPYPIAPELLPLMHYVWNSTARILLNNHNPAWLQGLAAAVPEAKWKLCSVGSHSTLNAVQFDR
eukprot:1159649-Pelagomonas_calceolata.AAC.13